MKFDFTGVSPETGGVSLPVGRYRVSTQDRWTVTKSESGNMNLRIPFTVLESGEYEGATSSYYHTIMLPPENFNSMADSQKKELLEKISFNKKLTLQLFLALGLLSEEDRTDDGLHAEFDYGDKDDYDRVAVNSLKVNGEHRSLENRIAIAVVVTNSYTKSGVKVERLEAAGKPDTSQTLNQVDTAPTPQPATPKANGIPF